MPIWLWEWGEANNIKPCYLKHGLQINSIIIIWVLVINAEPQAPPQTYWICILTRSPGDLHVNQSLRSIGVAEGMLAGAKSLRSLGGWGSEKREQWFSTLAANWNHQGSLKTKQNKTLLSQSHLQGLWLHQN